MRNMGKQHCTQGEDTHLQYTEQLLHVGPLGLQQLVHHVPAAREKAKAKKIDRSDE